MSGRTHAVVPAGIVAVFSQGDPYLSLAAAVGGIVPDIDEPFSVIGQRLWFLAVWMKYVFGHRTVSHSLVIVGVLLVLGIILLIPPVIVLAFCAGWGTHLVLDGMSGGVQLWWPSKRRWVLARFPVYGMVDQLCLVSGMVLFLLGMWMHMEQLTKGIPSNNSTQTVYGTKEILRGE